MSAAARAPILKELSPSPGFLCYCFASPQSHHTAGHKRKAQEEFLLSPFNGFKHVRVVISKLLWPEQF